MDTSTAPPHNAEVEQFILGAVLSENAAMASAGLDAEAFYLPRHQLIWRAMTALADAGKPIDLVSLKQELQRAGRATLENVGGAAYLASLIGAGAPRVTNLAQWATIVRRCAALRRLVSIGAKLYSHALAPEADPEDLVERALAALIERSGALDAAWSDNAAVMREVMRRIEAREAGNGILGLTTGLPQLDERLGGMEPGSLVLVGGRPSDGKSALAGQIAAHVAALDVGHVAFFSLEMTAAGMMERWIAGEARVNLRHLHLAGHRRQERYDRIVAAGARLISGRIALCGSARTVARMRLLVRQLQARGQAVPLVVVDYAQLVDARAGVDQRREQVSEVTRDLKAFATEAQCVVLAPAQLRRPSAGDKAAPDLADIAESDEPGRAADQAILIQRVPLKPSDAPTPGTWRGRLHVAKNRTSGGTGHVDVDFISAEVRFREASS